MTLVDDHRTSNTWSETRFALLSFDGVDDLRRILQVAFGLHFDGRLELRDAMVIAPAAGEAWAVHPIDPAATLDHRLDDLPDPLSPRERELLPYLPSRLTNRELARELFVSLNTVKTHLRHIYRKLGVNNRDEAVARIREFGSATSTERSHPGGVMRRHPTSPDDRLDADRLVPAVRLGVDQTEVGPTRLTDTEGVTR